MSQDLAPQVSEYAEGILKRIDIFNNPYFQQLRDGSMSLEEFRESQLQFFYAVDFFSRPMSALVARIPDSKARLSILHNIVEEHGDMNSDEFHSITFKQFLRSLGYEQLDYSKIPIWPQLRAFNGALATACMLDEIEVGIACMGIIERSFATISVIIADSVIKNGWIKKEDLCHYKLHAELDIKHAADFFVIVEPLWSQPMKQHFIKQGLELGAYIFDRLYRDLISYKVK